MTQSTDRTLLVMLCAAAAVMACKKPDGGGAGSGAPATGSAAVAPATTEGANAATTNKITIGVLTDMSGPYADLAGKGSVVAAQLAVDEAGGKVGDLAVEIVQADHQNKPDVGSTIARKWFDTEGVDVIVDVPTSSVALAVSAVAQEKNKILLDSGAGTSDLTGKACSPNTIHWAYDTYALANTTGREMVKNGGDSWFFVTVDYAFGAALERDATKVIEGAGGKVLGEVKHPFKGTDFSSYLLQAQSSKAKVIALANAGGDTINAMKQAAEFGIISKGQKMVGLLTFITDVNALGLDAAQGLILSESFYWDRDDKTRAWAKKFADKMGGAMPTMVHAGVYSSVKHYLKALAELKGARADGKAVVAKMEAMPTDDDVFGAGTIDPNGRKRHSMYVYQVKTPAESKAKWDYYKLIREVPAAEAFRAPADSDCPFIKK